MDWNKYIDDQVELLKDSYRAEKVLEIKQYQAEQRKAYKSALRNVIDYIKEELVHYIIKAKSLEQNCFSIRSDISFTDRLTSLFEEIKWEQFTEYLNKAFRILGLRLKAIEYMPVYKKPYVSITWPKNLEELSQEELEEKLENLEEALGNNNVKNLPQIHVGGTPGLDFSDGVFYR